MLYIKNMEDISEIIKRDSKKNCFYNFIQWLDNKLINKCVVLYKYYFNKITIRNFGDKKIYILPWKEEKNNKIKVKKLNKLYENINKENKKDKLVVLSNCLNEDSKTIEILYKKGIEILDGRWLLNLLTNKVVQYISKCKNKNLKEQNLAILINNPDDVSMYNITKLAEEVKNLKIVTNNQIYFKRLEQKLYAEKGVPILVVNNKKKSLLNSDIILNVDFSEKELNNYSLNKNAILVNVNSNIKIYAKAFKGINVNWYKIKLNEEYSDLFNEYNLSNRFDENILYESLIYSKDKLHNIINRLNQDKTEIQYLVGIKGRIQEVEYLNNT